MGLGAEAEDRRLPPSRCSIPKAGGVTSIPFGCLHHGEACEKTGESANSPALIANNRLALRLFS
jgi:hypothetical protein